MAFTYEWQTGGFSYNLTNSGNQSKKRKKLPHCDVKSAELLSISNDVAIDFAIKKLRMCSDESAAANDTSVVTINSTASTNIKSALKNRKKGKKLSVSFVDIPCQEKAQIHDTLNCCNPKKSIKQELKQTSNADRNKKSVERRGMTSVTLDDLNVPNSTSITRNTIEKKHKNKIDGIEKLQNNMNLTTGVKQSTKHTKEIFDKKSKLQYNDTAHQITASSNIGGKKQAKSYDVDGAKKCVTLAATNEWDSNSATTLISSNLKVRNKKAKKKKLFIQDNNAECASISSPTVIPQCDSKNEQTVFIVNSGQPSDTSHRTESQKNKSLSIAGTHKKNLNKIKKKQVSKNQDEKFKQKICKENLKESPNHRLHSENCKQNKHELLVVKHCVEPFSVSQYGQSSSCNQKLPLDKHIKKVQKKLHIPKEKCHEENISDSDWSDMDFVVSEDDEDAEVQEFEDSGDQPLDENFHSDLKALLSQLNFTAVKAQIEKEEEEVEKNVKGRGETADVNVKAPLDKVKSHINTEDSGTKLMESNNLEKNKKDFEVPEINISTDKCKKEIKISKNHKNGESYENSTSAVRKTAGGSVDMSKLSASLAKFERLLPCSQGPEASTCQSGAAQALAEKMRSKLNVAKFRMINEKLYSSTGAAALQLFKRDPDAFRLYHDGFKSQVALWPLNPLDVIVDWLKTQNRDWVVADFGCGEAELSERVQQRVHSLDLVATKPQVTVCDMAHTPLPPESVHVAVFCLSLMGTNVRDFIAEANRILKKGGVLKIAEVESRITNMEEFVASVQKFGFKCNRRPVNHNYFVTMDFKKFKSVKNKNDLPNITLKPCLYKKR